VGPPLQPDSSTLSNSETANNGTLSKCDVRPFTIFLKSIDSSLQGNEYINYVAIWIQAGTF